MDSDGRSAVRLRHRRAILDAAVELIGQGDGDRFSADELADHAGVSRRTIFNHFASLDDVLLDVCSETLDVLAAQLRAQAGSAPISTTLAPADDRSAMFAAMSRALRDADLSGPILQVWRALGGPTEDDHRTRAFAQQALARVADELSTLLRVANPHADPLDIELLASLLAHGLGVIASHWIVTTPPGRAPSRADWDELLERLLDTVGAGFLPRTRTHQDAPNRTGHT